MMENIFFFHDFILLTGLMLLGAWLQGINGRHGFIDECLTPFPLAIGGVIFMLFERL